MAAPKRRAAEIMFWLSPHDQKCTLQPLDETGAIEMDLVDGEVHVRSRNCLYSIEVAGQTDDFELAEFEFSVPVHRCQINWHWIEKGAIDEIERSNYYQT